MVRVVQEYMHILYELPLPKVERVGADGDIPILEGLDIGVF
jgi:hypothetical protein